MSASLTVYVTEVHNFGGFFGGDTVTLSAMPWPGGTETTWTIDEKALDNVSDRHIIAPGMVLQFDLHGERVDRARVIAARDWETLRNVLGSAPAERLAEPRVRAYRCSHCALWIEGQPTSNTTCVLCGQLIAD